MDGIDVYRVWSYMASNEGVVKRMLDFCSFMVTSFLGSFRIRSPDIVIATSPQLFAGLSGYLVGRAKRRPFVFEVRDLWPEQVLAIGLMREGRILHLFKCLAKYLYIHSDLVVTVGEGYKEQIIDGYSISRDHIKVIPNGVFPDAFCKNGGRHATRKEYGLENRFVVVFIGTHGMSQKLETILEAAESIGEEHICFVFVGDGAEKTKLLEEKAQRKLKNCLFFPAVSKEEVPAIYEAADLCIVPLRKSELFKGNYPSKIFEAMAMECPIVMSGEGMSAALVENAKAGISVAPEDPDALARAVKRLYQDRALRIQMGENGRKFVMEYYSRKVWAEQYERILGTIAT
jgi:glycosyltransferase involved in cell wall biosynthesis